ncbi:major facilitator superfamily domain-containing protein [Geopyxis carbonaria]|nr:major facilitator superfamily domain-containing protein [Geopyxis carbonaria]
MASAPIPVSALVDTEKTTIDPPVESSSITLNDDNLVTWDGPSDPTNPMNWSKKRKWLLTLSLCTHCLGVTMGSSVVAPGIIDIALHFGVSVTIATLSLSLYVLGWALGPLVFSPVSEIYGRKTVLLPSAVLYAIFLFGAAVSQNITTLLFCRLLAGIFGSPITAVAAGFVYDMFSMAEVGPPIFLIVMVSFLGPAIGPLAGGYLVQEHGWRWIMWFIAIFNGADLVIWTWQPETHASTILGLKCKRLIKETGNIHLRHTTHGIPTSAVLKVALLRPFQLLLLEPIVILTTVFVAMIWGILYLYFGAYPIVFTLHYGWDDGPAGAAMMGIGIGAILSAGAAGYSNKLYQQLCVTHGKNGKFPEGRLPLAMLSAILAPISIFWFAWTSKGDIHWLAPVASGVLFGFSMAILFISFISYLTDSFPEISSSALAANSVVRSLFAAAFPLFTPDLFKALDSEWAVSLLGFITIALAPIPFVFYKYGQRIRERSRFTPRFVD